MDYVELTDRVNRAACRLQEEKAPYWVSEQLPWRRLRTPYRIFLAEFLLVRTRARAVAEIFESVVTRYPDLESLASADEHELASALESLGLRKRVPLLQKAARYLVEIHEGRIPEKIEDLAKVPGLGLYTSVAVAAFAYGCPKVPADVNVLRFLSRLVGLPMEHPTKGSKDLRALLPFLSPDMGGPAPESLLDFSRTICCRHRPRCSECAVANECIHFSVVGQEETDS
jgi:A/G-specific adenine glycosylase